MGCGLTARDVREVLAADNEERRIHHTTAAQDHAMQGESSDDGDWDQGRFDPDPEDELQMETEDEA